MPWYQVNVHWYIVGGQYTYQACISIAAKKVPGSARHKFYTEFDVDFVYSCDLDILIKVSNALNNGSRRVDFAQKRPVLSTILHSQ